MILAVAAPIDEELVENLQKLLGKVDQMKAQRKQLESDLREKVQSFGLLYFY